MNNKKIQHKTATGRSGYKGVSAQNGKFIAQIKVNQVKYHLGSYATADEAAIAYNKKCKAIYGKKAILNKV